MSDEVYTPTTTNAHIFSSNVRALITSAFGLFCIFSIMRYNTRSIESAYRFHLLNMAVWILACDLVLLVLCRPYPLLPMNGGCFIGELNALITEHMDLDDVINLQLVIVVVTVSASMATVFNATVHRYLFVIDLVGQSNFHLPKVYVNIFMFVIQIVWPVVGSLIAVGVDLRPAKTVEESKSRYSDIYKRTIGKPCLFFAVEVTDILITYGPKASVFALQIIFCGLANFVLLAKCWTKILNARLGTVSKRTIKMQRHLLMSLSVQSVLPYMLFAVGAGVFLMGYLLNIGFLQVLTNHVFLYVSLHSAMNCLIVFTTLPTYSKGLKKDLNTILCCGRYQSSEITVATTNVSFANSSTRIIPINLAFFKRVVR